MARDVEGPMDEATEMSRTFLDHDALERAADRRTKDPEIRRDVHVDVALFV